MQVRAAVCIADAKCTDPLLSVSLMHNADRSSQVIDAELCANHAVAVSDAGFSIMAWTNWSLVTHLIPRDVLREWPISWLREDVWVEMFDADSLICRYHCKVHGRLFKSETDVTGWSIECRVVHVKTYGCKVGR